VENWDAVLSDGVHYHMRVYGSFKTGEMHQILEGGLKDKVEGKGCESVPETK
jgi:hypothetical protein